MITYGSSSGFHSRRIGPLCAVLTLCAFTIGTGFAATVTINPVKDNTIYQGIDLTTAENFEDNSCGAGTDFFSGVTNDGFKRRALLRFDIAAGIPAGSTINRVTLTLNVNRSGDNQTATMTLRPVSKDWGEGTVNCSLNRGGGQGLPAAVGDATWLAAKFQQVLWTTAGGDFGAVSGSASAPAARGDAIWDSAAAGNAVMVSDVQNWLNSPVTNNGWIVVGDEARSSTTRRFGSREGSVPPKLLIDFTPTGNVYACCFTTGNCTITDTTSCTSQGGTPNTSVTTCEPNPCPQPVGACCNPDETCSNSVSRTTCEAAGGIFQGANTTCTSAGVDCGLTPFVDALPIPAVLQRVSTRADGVPQYAVTITQQRQKLHTELPLTDVWTYNGTYPGPTIEATVGQPIEVKYTNSLPSTGKRGAHYLQVDECAHGPNYWRDTQRTVVHLHGGHVPARVDGQPEYDIMPGEFDVYEYPNNQLPATLWYHDHALGITRLNVYMGLAAFYLLRDSVEIGLGLPSGEYEIPLAVQDREFTSDGTLFYPPTIQDAFLGDKVLVNGKVWPYLNVKQGKYRFRILNGSQARLYRMRLENKADPAQVIPFQLIGTDGGLISAPITLNSFNMAPAERFDVVVNFAGFPAGTEIVLKNDQREVPDLPNVMKFVVQGIPGHTAALPATLRTVTPIPETQATVTRRFELERMAEPCAGGEWLVKSLDALGNVIGMHWDDITEFPVLGTTEIWEFQNVSNMLHPMHVHLVMFQVLDRNGLASQRAAWEVNTWKDTVRVPPQGRVRIIMKFEDYLGKFPYHCHILDHEDHEMMRQFQAINNPANCNNNGVCNAGEDCRGCPNDCRQVSGAFCGNGLCEPGDGEDCLSCSADCYGKQKGSALFCCGDGAGTNPVGCADSRCSSGAFFCRTTPRVPACCGDKLCEGKETTSSCGVDCAAAVNCASYTTSGTCTANPACTWNAKTKKCVNR